jgi:hypothetical protein
VLERWYALLTNESGLSVMLYCALYTERKIFTVYNFLIRTLRLGIIKVLFIHQLMHK